MNNRQCKKLYRKLEMYNYYIFQKFYRPIPGTFKHYPFKHLEKAEDKWGLLYMED